MTDDIWRLDATAMAAGIRAGDFSSRDAVSSCLHRLDEVDCLKASSFSQFSHLVEKKRRLNLREALEARSVNSDSGRNQHDKDATSVFFRDSLNAIHRTLDAWDVGMLVDIRSTLKRTFNVRGMEQLGAELLGSIERTPKMDSVDDSM